MNLAEITAAACAGTPISRADALAILAADDAATMEIVAAAGRVREHFFGRTVKLNHLVNLKSGRCPEDCHYCSQALGSEADILKYSWLTPEEIRASVAAGIGTGASTVCLVASGRGPSQRETGIVAEAIEEIRAAHPDVKICACLGFVDDAKATRLRDAGADRYNHNLNTAETRYADICSTHTYADRAATVEAATGAGLSACSGLIAGMGETDEQLVEVAFALRDLGVDSVPVNFLLPFEGTPLAATRELTPLRCLRILAMVRLVHPDVEVRAAAGREYHLRSLQPLALQVCNSIFLGGYLTSEGQSGADDLAMIADLGLEVVGVDPDEVGRTCTGGGGVGGAGGGCCGSETNTTPATGVVTDASGVRLRRHRADAQVN